MHVWDFFAQLFFFDGTHVCSCITNDFELFQCTCRPIYLREFYVGIRLWHSGVVLDMLGHQSILWWSSVREAPATHVAPNESTGRLTCGKIKQNYLVGLQNAVLSTFSQFRTGDIVVMEKEQFPQLKFLLIFTAETNPTILCDIRLSVCLSVCPWSPLPCHTNILGRSCHSEQRLSKTCFWFFFHFCFFGISGCFMPFWLLSRFWSKLWLLLPAWCTHGAMGESKCETMLPWHSTSARGIVRRAQLTQGSMQLYRCAAACDK